MKKKNILAALALLLSLNTAVLNANSIYPLKAFTTNGNYFDDSDLNLYVEVTPAGSMIDFEFYNESLVNSCIAEIYFDGNDMLSFVGISEGPGTSFNTSVTPHNLPAGREFDIPFEADFGIDADSPGPQNGINPAESLTIHCNLINGATIGDVTNALNNSDLRIGVHVIALPDGSSESAIIPEPATVLLLGLGAMVLRRKTL